MEQEKEMEQWIVNGFKNHESKLWDLGNVKVLDFKQPGTSNWYIRFTFLEDVHKLVITGDLGCAVAEHSDNLTLADFHKVIYSLPYFEEKIKIHSDAFWEYDQEAFWEELLKDYKDCIDEYILKSLYRVEEMTPEEKQEALEDELEDFKDAIFEDFSWDRGLGSQGFNLLSEAIPDFFESARYIGRKKTERLEMYRYAFQEAMKRLPEGEKDKIRKFREKIQELADMLPDYGERMDEYDPVLDDLYIKYKSVAYHAERLAEYTKR